jgi:hypothetical protein
MTIKYLRRRDDLFNLEKEEYFELCGNLTIKYLLS